MNIKNLSSFRLLSIVILLIVICASACNKKQDTPETITKEPNIEVESNEKQMHFGLGGVPEDSNLGRLAIMTLTEAFSRMDYTFTAENLPNKRVIHLMDTDRIDGDVIRIFDFNKANEHPNYVRINENTVFSHWGAFVTDSTIKIDSWADLKKGNYRVGYLAGIKLSEQNLIGLIDAEKLIVQSKSNLNGLRQLIENRIDVYVFAGYKNVGFDFSTVELQEKEIYLAGELEVVPSYPYLHKKHKELAPILEQTIRDIKNEGLYDKFVKQIEDEQK